MPLQDDIRTLSKLPAFGSLEPDALRLVALSAEARILRAGDVLFRKGDAADGGYIVLGGRLTLETGDGAATTVLPPALLGEAALLTETARPATARARDACSVLKVPRALYRRVLTEYPSSAERVRKLAAKRLLELKDDYETLRQTLLM